MAKKERAVQSDVGRSQMADGNSSGDGIEETVDSPVTILSGGNVSAAAESIDADSILAYDGANTQEQRERMIAEAAYYIAQRRGSDLGSPLEDWLIAEAQIDAFLSNR
jgi:hypothetical protein